MLKRCGGDTMKITIIDPRLGHAQQLKQLGFLHISIQPPLGIGFESTIKLHP
jgi:hypothetical protein